MNELQSTHIEETLHGFGDHHRNMYVYDNLQTPVSDDVLVLDEKHQDQIASFTRQALASYGPLNDKPEQTLVHSLYGLPTMLGRVDCTIQNNRVVPYELEDSPSGTALSSMLITGVTGHGITDMIFGHYVRRLPGDPHLIVSGNRNHGTDDQAIFGCLNYHYSQGDLQIPAEVGDNPVIVKTIPGNGSCQEAYGRLSEQAFAPLLTEGDKTYCLRTGIAKPLHSQEDVLTDADGNVVSQAIKTRIGSMAMGVSVYLTPADRKLTGASGITGAKLRRMAETYAAAHGGTALVQEYAPPIRTINRGKTGNMILRVFVLADRDEKGDIRTQVIGGCYVVRPEIIVHGASNSVAGAIVVN